MLEGVHRLRLGSTAFHCQESHALYPVRFSASLEDGLLHLLLPINWQRCPSGKILCSCNCCDCVVLTAQGKGSALRLVETAARGGRAQVHTALRCKRLTLRGSSKWNCILVLLARETIQDLTLRGNNKVVSDNRFLAPASSLTPSFRPRHPLFSPK